MSHKRFKAKTPALWLAGILVPGLLWAGMANVPTQWSEGLENWSASSDSKAMTATNQNGAVVLMYRPVTLPQSQTGILVADDNASYGMFAGDLLNIGATAVSFRVTSIGAPLSYMVLKLKSLAGQSWRHTIPLPPVNESVQVTVPFTFSPSWSAEGFSYRGNSGLFYEALTQVYFLGIEIMRGASLAQHGCMLDDFKLVGPSIRGAALYAGEQPGSLLKIRAEVATAPLTENKSIASVYAASAEGPAGTFAIDDAAAPQAYRLKAYLDVNSNSTLDFWEPRGEWAGGEFVFTAPLDNADIVLTDPTTVDNVPLWWLVQNCGVTTEDQVLSPTAGSDMIRDWAGKNFTVRIVNLGDGRVALRWKHIPGKQFQVVGGEAPGAGLLARGSPVQSLNATGEQENEVIQEITGSAAQFYRIKLVSP